MVRAPAPVLQAQMAVAAAVAVQQDRSLMSVAMVAREQTGMRRMDQAAVQVAREVPPLLQDHAEVEGYTVAGGRVALEHQVQNLVLAHKAPFASSITRRLVRRGQV